MKKLLALPALGAAAALTFGAAANLNITNAANLQVGETWGLSCADSVEVTAWGYREDINPGGVANATVQVVDYDGDCAGNWLYVTPLGSDGTPLPLYDGDGTPDGRNTVGAVQLGSGGASYTVKFGYTPNSTTTGPELYVNAQLLEGARIGIDQGA